MLNPTASVLVMIAVCGAIVSNIVFRYAAQESGWNWLMLFSIGIVIGFSVPLCITLALARENPNVIYALMSGLSCSGLQIAAWFVFREPLTPWQIGGIVMICCGAILVSIRSNEPVREWPVSIVDPASCERR